MPSRSRLRTHSRSMTRRPSPSHGGRKTPGVSGSWPTLDAISRSVRRPGLSASQAPIVDSLCPPAPVPEAQKA